MKLLVRGARQLLTLRGPDGPRRGSAMRELGIIENGSLLIENGLITEVGPTRRVENLASARDAKELDATGLVVMPGFIDSHAHLMCGPPQLQSYEARLSGGGHRESHKNSVASAITAIRSMSTRTMEQQTRTRLRSMLRYGVTTAEAKSGYGLDEAGELKALRAAQACCGQPVDVLATFYGARAIAPEFEGKPDHYLDWLIVHMLPLIQRRRLARFVDICCDPEVFSIAQCRRYLLAARQLGFELRVHAEQFAWSGGARLAVEMGAISVDHLEHAAPDDADLVAGSWTIATLLPASSLHLGSCRFAPARAFIDAGAAVALATGFNMETSPTYNMQLVISLACSWMRMTPAEAITAATANAAWALGIADRAGTLAYGKRADVLIMNAPDYREIPYFCGVNLLQRVIKNGRLFDFRCEESTAA